MKAVKETAPAICEQCSKVFETKYAFYCPECRKNITSERARKINLSELGHKSRKGVTTMQNDMRVKQRKED